MAQESSTPVSHPDSEDVEDDDGDELHTAVVAALSIPSATGTSLSHIINPSLDKWKLLPRATTNTALSVTW